MNFGDIVQNPNVIVFWNWSCKVNRKNLKTWASISAEITKAMVYCRVINPTWKVARVCMFTPFIARTIRVYTLWTMVMWLIQEVFCLFVCLTVNLNSLQIKRLYRKLPGRNRISYLLRLLLITLQITNAFFLHWLAYCPQKYSF